MIDLSKVSPTKVSDISLGHLVLYPHGEEQLFAVRVDVGSGDTEERAGLLILSIDAGGSAPEPFVFPEVGHNFCLHLGKPTIAWEGSPASIVAMEGGTSPLIVARDGIVLLARTNQRSSDRLGFNLGTGAPVRFGHAFRVNNWQIGVTALDGEFCPLVKYPEHYQKKKAR